MKIGKATIPESAICASDDETIVVRGADLCKELIGRLSFTDYFWLLVTGQRPSPMASRVLDATLVAIAEHGLVPSVQASRMTLAAVEFIRRFRQHVLPNGFVKIRYYGFLSNRCRAAKLDQCRSLLRVPRALPDPATEPVPQPRGVCAAGDPESSRRWEFGMN